MLFPKSKKGIHSHRMLPQDVGEDRNRDLLRCSSLEELWRSGLRGGLKTEEEAMLWNRLSCETVLKGGQIRENENIFHGGEDHENREKSEKVSSPLF